ncbi:transcription termination/antitermination protein NusG [Chloroflexota bacterium]
MEAWYVAKTKPSKERMVETYLTEGQGVEVFLPLIRRPADKKAGWEPLFPTYLFCLVDPQSSDWGAIRWAPGLSYFLGASQELVPVPDEIIARLKQRTSWWNEDGYVPHFAPGEGLEVTSGPFSGLEAIFQRYIPARQRCQVLLQILGRLAKVEVPAEVLKGKSPYRGLVYAT